MKLITALMVAVGLTACGGEPNMMHNGKFGSMQSCMVAIQLHTNSDLRIVRDTPNIVSGYAGKVNGRDRFFACELTATGSQGTFIHGYWDAEKKSAS